MMILRFLIQVIICVVASLAGVWLLSQAIGMRFNPSLVAAISGSFASVMFVAQRRMRKGPAS